MLTTSNNKYDIYYYLIVIKILAGYDPLPQPCKGHALPIELQNHI